MDKEIVCMLLNDLKNNKDVEVLFTETLDQDGLGKLFQSLLSEDRFYILTNISKRTYYEILLRLAVMMGTNHIARACYYALNSIKEKDIEEHYKSSDDIKFTETDPVGIDLIYSLEGNDPEYILPMLYNIMNYDHIYPNADMVVYYKNISDEMLRIMEARGIELHKAPEDIPIEYARFLHLTKGDRHKYFRDADSILTVFEAKLTEKIQRENIVSTLKDSVMHNDPVMAANFNIGGYFSSDTMDMESIIKDAVEHNMSDQDMVYGLMIMTDVSPYFAEFNMAWEDKEMYQCIIDNLEDYNKTWDLSPLDRPGFHIGCKETRFFTIQDEENEDKVFSVDVNIEYIDTTYKFNFTGKEINVPAWILDQKYRYVSRDRDYIVKVDIR